MTSLKPSSGHNNASFGVWVKQKRTERNWTLVKLGDLTGLSISALSKIENDHVSTSFDSMARIMNAFGLDLDKILEIEKSDTNVSARRTITRADDAVQLHNKFYDYHVHSTELLNKALIPLHMQIRSREVPPIDEWSRHAGEEFIYVVAGGPVELYTEFYEPSILNNGDSAYIDSMMRHAFVSLGENDASILSACVTRSLKFDDIIISNYDRY